MRNRTIVFGLTLLSFVAFVSPAVGQPSAEKINHNTNASARVVIRMVTFADMFRLPERLQSSLIRAAETSRGGGAASEPEGEAADATESLLAGDGRAQSALEREALAAIDEHRSSSDDSNEDSSAEGRRTDEQVREDSASSDEGEPSGFESLATGGRDGSQADRETSLGMGEDVSTGPEDRPSADAPVDLGVRGPQKSVQEVLGLYHDEVTDCYSERLARNPRLSGVVTVEFVVEESGDVSASRIEESSLNDESTEACMVRTIENIDFPRPSSGRTTWNVPYYLGVKPE